MTDNETDSEPEDLVQILPINKRDKLSKLSTKTIPKMAAKTKDKVSCQFKCDKCNFKTFNPRWITEHKKEFHPKEKSQPIPCGKTKDRQESKSYVCDQCDHKEDSEQEMDSHITSQHGQPSKQGCDQRNLKTDKKHALQKHDVSQHGQPKMQGCDICKLKPDTKWGMNKHIKMEHSQPNKYGCENSSKTFT